MPNKTPGWACRGCSYEIFAIRGFPLSMVKARQLRDSLGIVRANDMKK